MSYCGTRREFLKRMGMGAAALAATEPARAIARKPKRPNIIYFMADDHAANAFKCYGSRLADIAPTSNIERLAREGMRLDNCFCTNSICTPSRAAILTGKYSQKNGVYTLANVFDGGQPHVAKQLQKIGYETAIVGKWHLKSEPTGFDYYCVLPGQGRYHNPMLKEKGKMGSGKFMGHQCREFDGYSSDVIGSQAINWLDRRETDKPFFLMCHFKAPHGLWEPPKRYENLFDGIDIPEPDSLWEDKSHRSKATRTRGSTVTPNHPRSMVARTTSAKWPTGTLDITGMNEIEQGKAAYQKYLKDYLGCVAAINDNVGRVLDYLDTKGMADDTVVIYTSDQGQYLGEHDYYDKRWMYEESLRMPFLVRYPQEIEAGSVNDDICLNIDFAPTFLDYACQPTPGDMQGRSFRQNLAGTTPSDWRSSMYYRYWMHLAHHDNPAHYGVRTKEFKLIFFYGLPLDAKGAKSEPSQPGWELYDLRVDPKELNNVYGKPEYTDVTKELKSELLRLKRKVGDTDERYPELMKVREQYWD